MCGIVGIIAGKAPIADAVGVLERLEYRGYDSAGLASLTAADTLDVRKEVGKLSALKDAIATTPLAEDAKAVIGHTRWATHGAATKVNAHPHTSPSVAVVHNGIIENFRDLKAELTAKGYHFQSDTDTEVVALLIQSLKDEGAPPQDAFIKAVQQLEGAYALAVLQIETPGLLYGARAGSPLLIGYKDGSSFLASDAIGLGPLADKLQYLEEGDCCILSKDGAAITDSSGATVTRDIQSVMPGSYQVVKGNYRHFMQKEMYEQPEVVAQTLSSYVDFSSDKVTLPDWDLDLSTVSQVTLIACGTSYHAVLVASYWLEALARVPVRTDIASEFRYRNPVLAENGLAVFVSQSGETADTLAALRYVKAAGQKTLAIVNVPSSSIAREADYVLVTQAGPEVAVASTKAFPCQLTCLAVFTLALAEAQHALTRDDIAGHLRALEKLPALMRKTLKLAKQCAKIGYHLAKAQYILFVGRGIMQAIALEGALKLKEISYISAEGYPAGELKHGPISLIDENVPVIGIAMGDQLLPKTVSNLEEIQARGGQIYLIHDADVAIDNLAGSLRVEQTSILTAPMVAVIPAQLLSYYTAAIKGTDVDQPRNLAKSVTVE